MSDVAPKSSKELETEVESYKRQVAALEAKLQQVQQELEAKNQEFAALEADYRILPPHPHRELGSDYEDVVKHYRDYHRNYDFHGERRGDTARDRERRVQEAQREHATEIAAALEPSAPLLDLLAQGTPS